MFRTFSLLALSVLLITACKKDEDAPTPTPTPATCGVAGARLQATFDGTAFCANTSLFASLALGLTVSGIASDGSTLSLELDSLTVGTFPIKEGTNTVLFTTNLALGYTAVDADPGTLIIASNDTVTNRIQGSIEAPLYSGLGGAPKNIGGSFDLYYIE